MSKKKKKEWADGLEDWGSYMAAKKAKLEDQFDELTKAEFTEATNLFKGIAIFVNGYTRPCADELRRLMMEHGGIYHHYLRPGVTSHLIASNLPYTKIIAYRKSKNPLPLCKPEWITDSIKANKLLDWRPYLLYNSTSVTQPALNMNPKLEQNSELQNTETNIEDFSLAGHSITDKSVITSTSNQVSPEILEENPAKIRNENVVLHDKDNINGDNESIAKIEAKKLHGAALCSKDEQFLTEFYNNSRLHHIATMGATFKEYVNELRSKNAKSLPGLERLVELSKHNVRSFVPQNSDDSDEDIFDGPTKLRMTTSLSKNKLEPVIMHIDMDCFFVSVGLRNKPEFRGLPVAVTHARGQKPVSPSNDKDKEFMSMAEIASCSYEARKFGIKNGMFLGQALKLCPNLKTIKYDFEGYKEVSYNLYDTVASYTLEIEAVSCDEMYADISSVLYQCRLTPSEFAIIIRKEIQEKTGCPVSTGFGSNKLQARLATKKAKPNGQFHLKPEDVGEYIGAINVREIPGVGYSMYHQLKNLNIKICSDLKEIPISTLKKQFGQKTGEMLYNACRGIDTSKLNTDHVRKSVSAEVNYGIRFVNDQDAREFLKKLSKEVSNRLIKMNAKGRCITLKLMVRAKGATKEPAKFMGHGVCDNFTKSKNFLSPVDDETIIFKDAWNLLEQMKQPADDMRGIGIHISRLETSKMAAAVAGDTCLMKFITKGKRQIANESDKVAEQDKIAGRITKINNENVEINVENNSDVAEKNFGTIDKHQERDNFFNKKKSPTLHSKTSCNSFETLAVIDKETLNKLPDDKNGDILSAKINNEMKLSGQDMDSKNRSDELFGDVKPATHEIDDEIITKLPDEINDENLATKPIIKKSENCSVQNKVEVFNSPKLPNVQELDMQVLIELPDNIRNEILNHYKSRNKRTENIERMKDDIKIPDEIDIPFSENNPNFSTVHKDFIADELKPPQNGNKFIKINNNKGLMSKETENRPQNVIKIRKRGRPPKNSLQNNLIVTNNKNNKIKFPKVRNTRNKVGKKMMHNAVENNEEVVKNDENDDESTRYKNFLTGDVNISKHVKLNDRDEAIKIHQLNLQGWKVKSEHQEMLMNLVNYLFGIPLHKIKNQIQTWISNSTQVNDIDILSIATFLSMLPKERRIEDLHILMKTMYRCISKNGTCVWHETYKKTVSHIQPYMQIEFNCNLILPSIICNAPGCKN